MTTSPTELPLSHNKPWQPTVPSFILFAAILTASTASAAPPKVGTLWGTPEISQLATQDRPEFDKSAGGLKINTTFKNNIVSLQKPSDPLTGTALLDIDFPYDQSTQTHKAIAELNLGYQFKGNENTRASLIVLLDGKQVRQTTILGFSSSVSVPQKISRIKLGYKGNLRVTALCMISRQSTNDDAVCSLDSIELHSMKHQHTE